MSGTAHWRKSRLSRVAIIHGGKDYTAFVDEDGAYPVYGSGGEHARTSDPLFSGRGAIFGRKGTIDRPFWVDGSFWLSDTAYFLEPRKEHLRPRFLYYWATRFPFAFYATDTALPSLTRGDIGSESLLLPPHSDQDAITDFLDHETADIDALICELGLVLPLLAERWRATLDEKLRRPLRPSPLKRFGSLQTGITLGSAYPGEDKSTYLYVRVANVQAGYLDTAELKAVDVPERIADSSTLREGDILITEGGDRDKLGRGAKWPGSSERTLHQNHVFAFRCNEKLDPDYLVYLLEGSDARRYFDVTARQSTNLASTNSTLLLNLPIVAPSLPEQRDLVNALDHDAEILEREHADLTRAIALAKERRAALITAAVTGQIDVTAKQRPAAEQLEDDIKELS